MKNSTLNTRLKKYSAIAAGAVVSAPAIGQIVYVDLSPDVLISTGSTYSLDMDSNSASDINFAVFQQSGTYYGGLINYSVNIGGATAPGSNGFLASSSSFGSMVVGLSSGASIASSLSFTGASAALGGYVVVTGMYSISTALGAFNPNEMFMGVRFDISGSMHYGWIRARVTPDGTILVINDYAYNSVAGGSIMAGQTPGGGVGINELDISEQVSITSYKGQLTINVAPEITNANVRVTNVTGAIVVNQNLNTGYTIQSVEDLASGIYMVTVQSDQGVYTQKIYR